jgi:hypothetical protein
VTGSPQGDQDFVTNYRNQVGIWYSRDGGVNWQRANFLDSGFFADPTKDLGFSDPDLTQDAGGRVYDTGIDLANDSVFSSTDGGVTWPTGTAQCHDGDRPWLAGGAAGELFMSTDTTEDGHEVFRSTDGGESCSLTGATANGDLPDGGTWTGDGKLYFDRHTGALVEPAIFQHADGSLGVGVDVLRSASRAFSGTATPQFVPHEAVHPTTMFAHWPAIAIDGAGTLYLVWDTADRSSKGYVNSVELAYSRDLGGTWSKPYVVAHPGKTVLWPWIAAGSAGAVSVVWYQYDRVTDPDSGTGNVSVHEASIFGADSAAPAIQSVNASGRPVHVGDICQGGTLCNTSGKDRRMGDYFENSIDGRGCVIIAASDTMLTDPATGSQLPLARPLFMHQDEGTSLTGQDCGAAP